MFYSWLRHIFPQQKGKGVHACLNTSACTATPLPASVCSSIPSLKPVSLGLLFERLEKDKSNGIAHFSEIQAVHSSCKNSRMEISCRRGHCPRARGHHTGCKNICQSQPDVTNRILKWVLPAVAIMPVAVSSYSLLIKHGHRGGGRAEPARVK